MSLQGVEYLQSPAKRRLDFFGSLALGSLLSPVAAATAVGSMIDTKSFNPFFRQVRHSREGRPQTIVKFRSLPRQVEQEALRLYGIYDPRISRFGRFIRTYGLDEVPQLGSVLTGDMSLTGFSRPMTDVSLESYQAADNKLFQDWYDYFLATKRAIISGSSIYRRSVIDVTPDTMRESMKLDVNLAETLTWRGDVALQARVPWQLLHAAAGVSPDATAACFEEAA